MNQSGQTSSVIEELKLGLIAMYRLQRCAIVKGAVFRQFNEG